MSQPQPSSQSSQSFAMSQASASQSFRPFADPQPRPNQPSASEIYSASYSSVEVYEMEVNGIAVMRRRRDSWLNATQILKVAGVDKGKRTKILEKEIQTGDHEKVQGGYGKYQGTWIGFDRGLQVCRQYGVEEILRPLLTYDMGQDGGIAGSGDFNTPTKEQALAAQRKRMYSSMGNEGRTNGSSGTFFKNISSTASTAVAAISKARFDSPGPRGRNGPSRPPSFSRQSSMQNADDFPSNSQQSFASEYGSQVDSAYSTQNTQLFNGEEPPRKKQRVITPSESFVHPSSQQYASQSMELYANNFPGSPTEPNESFVYHEAGVGMEGAGNGVPLPPLPYEMSHEAEQRRNLLMGLFMDSNAKDFAKTEALQKLSPAELDSPIDTSSHTALHWAATLARISLLRALISAGSDPFRVNGLGETALMRACGVTNNSDQSSFPELLDALGSTIEVRDKKGRTVLHHIAVASAVKGRSQSSRYYLESLLEWVVRQGSAPSSQTTSGMKINLGRFMSEIVNAQDNSGDTALNIAARITNRSIISQLLEVGADPGIPNNTGLRPVDFGIKGNGLEDGLNGEAIDGNGTVDDSQKSRESSDDIIKSITDMLTDTATSFQLELKKKQTDLDSLHASLRTTSQQLGDAKRDLDSLQERARIQNLTRQKIYNLARGREEEQARLQQIEQSHGSLEPGAAAWESELAASTPIDVATLPSSTILRTRIQALRSRSEGTRKTVASLKSRSKDVEVKYRRVVALCSGVPEADVDAVIDGLLRAVESEKDGLEIGRVRRFLGGVDGVA
ncbi:hypothetical protein BKA67DRAFT_509808 [Truncatella angustata]|uniref:Transcription factor SWI6 n=1 Tax=Truncatella angustata TaxID=152316 RepID=A0A9P8UZ38_9PEZI|nr:uncharacterized protein BKA67DRAFT_509808 [Truncatella angustata]KAH6661017.1 hypothetical protein BKA67DRAFT_509808 [Truncatella angustata]KAH8203726.1 hypothetical protein TruAng_002139 [Truncatella angustata]